MHKIRNFELVVIFSTIFIMGSTAKADPFEIYDGADKYLTNVFDIFDLATWECAYNLDLDECLDILTSDRNDFHFVFFDLNTLTFLTAEEYAAQSALIESGLYPAQQRVIESVSARFKVRDEDDSIFDLSEWGYGYWQMGDEACLFSGEYITSIEIDNETWSCDLGSPSFSETYYLGWGYVHASVRDFEINNIKIWGDYSSLHSVPEPGTLALLGLGLVSMAARRRRI